MLRSIASWKKKPLYIASLIREDEDDYNNKYPVYSRPIDLGLQNIQPTTSNSDIQAFGLKVYEMQRVFLDYDQFLGKIKPNDLAYLDGATPLGEKVNGENANYRVYSVLNQNKKICIYFERLQMSNAVKT